MNGHLENLNSDKPQHPCQHLAQINQKALFFGVFHRDRQVKVSVNCLNGDHSRLDAPDGRYTATETQKRRKFLNDNERLRAPRGDISAQWMTKQFTAEIETIMKVSAIDIGYGNTKFTIKRDGQKIECRHFPSVAPVNSGVDIGGDALSRKNVAQVSVGGVEYIVGPDAMLSIRGGTGRVLSADYPERDGYLALVRGALSYMKQPTIDLLVTGLPVNFYRQYKERLTERLIGVHEFPNGNEVVINKAWVIPQPVGGFLNYAMDNQVYSSLRESNCLVIDIGFYTVDWLVCRGLKVIDERSGSVPGGMSKLLESLALNLSNELGEPFEDINRLDIALNNRNQLDWYGKRFDFSHLIPKVAPIINSACESMASNVGTFSDIAKVIVVGGGAKHYLSSIRKICHQNSIAEVDESIYANVRGFMIAGEQKSRSNG